VGFLAGEWRGVRALCPEPALSEFVGRLYELEEVLKYHPELKHAARACAAICSGITYLDSANSGGPAGLPEFALQERVHAGP
jgi:hypothetical protein